MRLVCSLALVVETLPTQERVQSHDGQHLHPVIIPYHSSGALMRARTSSSLAALHCGSRACHGAALAGQFAMAALGCDSLQRMTRCTHATRQERPCRRREIRQVTVASTHPDDGVRYAGEERERTVRLHMTSCSRQGHYARAWIGG